MTTELQRPASKVAFWAGWILSVLPCLMLFMSASMKLSKSEEFLKGFEHLGFPEQLALVLGIVEVGGTIIYLIPKTAVLGAILLTGYLGGAVATHARLLEGQFVAPALLGVLIWLGLYLRDPRLRDLVPIRK
jgi:hypothetical protein